MGDSTLSDQHPHLESIAAYLDGKLQAEERKQVAAHLAECAECYEIYTESVRFQNEDRRNQEHATVLPFGSRWRRRLPALAYPLAAGLTGVLAFALYQHFQTPPAPTPSGLVAQLDGGNLSKLAWQPDANRGAGEDDPVSTVLSFQIGAILLDLQVAVAEGNGEVIEATADNLRPLFARTSFPEPTDQERLNQARDLLLKPGTTPEQRRTAVATFEEILVRQAPSTPQYELGLWTEAGRLAASGGRTAFFLDRNNKRFAEKLPAQERGAREGVAKILDQIDDSWSETLSPKQRQTLATLFQNLLDAYDDPDALGG